GLYSASGFNVVGLLTKVVTRPNPQIDIGPVDMSCSFVVCDARQIDFPIVYHSREFSSLTGYSESEILGRNCRFLQAPDGKVIPGETRKFTDNKTVFQIREALMSGREIQSPLLNYKKGGQSFVNMITIVPIAWESPTVSFFVGFQIDIGQQQQVILRATRRGSYSVNYRRTHIPSPLNHPNEYGNASALRPGGVGAYGPHTPWAARGMSPLGGQTEILSALGLSDDEITEELLSRVLLANIEGFIYVISLRGTIYYMSSSVRRLLEYDQDELIGNSLVDYCHPSDTVNMTRDLKEASFSPEKEISSVFRVRRKKSGYIWLDNYGRQFTETIRRSKCILLIARELPVYKISYAAASLAMSTNNASDSCNQVWIKLSPTGILLFSSSQVTRLLGYGHTELIGKSIQSLAHDEREKASIMAALSGISSSTESSASSPLSTMDERSYMTNRLSSSVKHGVRTVRGDYRLVRTTFFPGNAPPRTALTGRQQSQQPSLPIPLVSRSQYAQEPGNVSLSRNEISSNDDEANTNFLEELEPARSTSWQFELRQMQFDNRRLKEEYSTLL
ncbi:hypothetical protein V1511DRAFT_452961, partial [Dipodascopsis uninucleata]